MGASTLALNDAGTAERLATAQRTLDQLKREAETLSKRLGLVDDDAAPVVIARLNEVSAARSAAQAGVDRLRFQMRHAEAMSKHLSVFDRRITEEWNRIDAMGMDEKRAVLRRFGLTAVLWRKDHTPRYAPDINFDLDDQWWGDDQWDDDDLRVIFTQEDSVLCSNSSA